MPKVISTTLNINLNANEAVSVRLNVHGMEALESYIANENKQLKKARSNHVISVPAAVKGVHTFPLWELMFIFGGYMQQGMDVPFENFEVLLKIDF